MLNLLKKLKIVGRIKIIRNFIVIDLLDKSEPTNRSFCLGASRLQPAF